MGEMTPFTRHLTRMLNENHGHLDLGLGLGMGSFESPVRSLDFSDFGVAFGTPGRGLGVESSGKAEGEMGLKGQKSGLAVEGLEDTEGTVGGVEA